MTIHRHLIFVTTLLFVGACASTTAPIEKSGSSRPALVVGDSRSTETDSEVAKLRREGYREVVKEGKTYYCRRETKTGFRLSEETVCMTKAEIDELQEITRRNMEQQRMPPRQN